MEVQVPELNPKIMSNRIAQLIERGTAFRRACLWTINTISNAGALGAEVTISGKLRSERAHFEKHSVGVLPKSGDVADKVVKVGVTHVLSKMGLMGIQLRIALKDQSPQEFEYTDVRSADDQLTAEKQPKIQQKQQQPEQQQVENNNRTHRMQPERQVTQGPKEERAVPVGGNANGQG
jgi:small subunit ribosomal protein S3